MHKIHISMWHMGMMSFIFSHNIAIIFVTNGRIFLLRMAAINYLWQRFPLPCGYSYHKGYHIILPKYSCIDSWAPKMEYSLTPLKEYLDTLRNPSDKCLHTCQCSLLSRISNCENTPIVFESYSAYHTIYLYQNHSSSTLSLPITPCFSFCRYITCKRSYIKSSEGERRTWIFQLKGSS